MKQFSINAWVDILQDAQNAIIFWWILLVKNISNLLRLDDLHFEDDNKVL